MIHVKDVEILDILPHTFKTDEYTALSKSIAAMTALLYETMSSVLFWADIENASSELLDAMAAELDAPFYSADMTIEQKRSVAQAAFEYNSRIGTVSSIEALLKAAFGGGKLVEWFDYDGEPYHFKVVLPEAENTRAEFDSLNYFKSNLEKFKNKRSKLDEIRTVIKPVVSTLYHSTATSIHGHIPMEMRKYNTFDDIRGMTYDEFRSKTYEEILYKE